MEPNRTQHNTQTALFAIAIVLALGVGFYMGYQTGYVNGGEAMHSVMHGSESATEEHLHTMMHDHTGTVDGATGAVSTSDAMHMMDHAAQ
jgi:uncharacterized protein HemX